MDQSRRDMKRLRRAWAALSAWWSRTDHAALMVLFAVLVVGLGVEMAVKKLPMNDFRVYHTAGLRLLGGENLYRPIEDGFYCFKYSPVAAMLFSPLSLLPLPVAKCAYWLLLSGTICLSFRLCLDLVRALSPNLSTGRANTVTLLAGLVLGVHLQRELHLGQVNALLACLYASLPWLLARGRTTSAAGIWAVSIFLKPFGLIFLPYFLLKRRFGLAGLCLLCLALLALTPVLFYGPGDAAGQYLAWHDALLTELSGKQALLTAGNHTIFSVAARYSPLRFLPLGPSGTMAYQAVLLLVIAALFLRFTRRHGPAGPLDYAFLCLLIPLLSFTSHNAFVFAELAVFSVLAAYPRLGAAWKGAAVAGLVLVGGNIYDLVGRRAWHAVNDASLITVGAVLLLLALAAVPSGPGIGETRP